MAALAHLRALMPYTSSKFSAIQQTHNKISMNVFWRCCDCCCDFRISNRVYDSHSGLGNQPKRKDNKLNDGEIEFRRWSGKKRQRANIAYAYVFERDTQRAGEGCNGLAVSVATTIYRIEKKFHEKKFFGEFFYFSQFYFVLSLLFLFLLSS